LVKDKKRGVKLEKTLGKPVLNNAKLTSSNKNSEIETKPGIQGNLKRHIDSDINIHSATRESFNAFAEDTFSPIQVYIFAKFLGYEGSIICVDHWVKAKYPKPDHLKVLLYEIQEMQEDVRKLREDVENFTVKRDAGVARIAQMQKEIRGTIAQVDLFTSAKDRKGLLLIGADRAIREMISIFKDDPIEGPLQEAAMSVWAKIQYEE
jgi:hypothetical protein